MTAPTDATVEERHRRATEELPIHGRLQAATVQVIANAERDGRASRDAEVAELSAYRRAWDTVLARCAFGIVEADEDETVDLAQTLAEELARKGTP